ncbi:Smr/MutS family protein [Paradevosia shaoguanensis]|uniref:Smr/MutS family protein n=1 Tax=Paradevosia shaoguanensis TaxID=1335043 RepID=UPI001933C0F5|nr:Smr/MutS family protein [Paradevosia shaoguanensis]
MAKRGKSGPPLRDWHLWTEVKRTIVPLRPEREIAPEPAGEPLPLPPAEPPSAQLPRDWTVGSATSPAPQRPAIHTRRTPKVERPIEPKLRRKLMRGQMEIDGTIDLHGMRQLEARAALVRFINARVNRGDRTVLVITGKGLKKTDETATVIVERGVLRSMLPLWLNEPDLAPLVSGWGPSAQGHGGEGAFYVRLKRFVP